MVERPDRNNQTAAIVVIIIVVILLALLVVLAFQFINVRVIEEPGVVEIERDVQSTPEPELPDEYIPALPAETDDPAEVRITIEDHFIGNVAVLGNSIYYSYTYISEGQNLIVVTRLGADGTEEQRTTIEWGSWSFWDHTFEITRDGDFLFLALEFEEDEEVYYFIRYNTADSALTYQKISDQLPIDLRETWIHTAAFDADGNIFLYLPEEDIIYILDRDGVYRGQVDVSDFWFTDVFQVRDGQLVLFGSDENFDLVLMGIDLSTNTLTRISTFESSLWAWGAYSGQNSKEFDLFIDFEYELYGYNIQTGELTFLLDWEEIGIFPDWGSDILFLENGQIAVLERHSTRHNFWAELIIFTP